jgi:hypothetical protein
VSYLLRSIILPSSTFRVRHNPSRSQELVQSQGNVWETGNHPRFC